MGHLLRLLTLVAMLVGLAAAPLPVSAALRAAPTTSVIAVSSMSLTSTTLTSGYRLNTRVYIQSNGTKVSGANVSIEYKYPNGSTASATATTNTYGYVAFSRTGTAPGTYTATVKNVTKSGRSYNASKNAVTSKSIAVGSTSTGSSMSVSSITLSKATLSSGYKLTSRAYIKSNGVAVPAASVNVKLTYPSGSTYSMTATTNTSGYASFSRSVSTKGTYTATVTNVTKSSNTYKPSGNAVTSKSLTISVSYEHPTSTPVPPTVEPTPTPEPEPTATSVAEPTAIAVEPTATPQATPVAAAYVTTDRSRQVGTSQLKPGVQIIQNTLYSSDPAVVERMLSVLAGSSAVTSVHTMAFGAPNPWVCRDGPLDWSYLDWRMNQAERAGQEIIVTIGMTPTWMLAGGADCTTDWNRVEDAPLPEHFDSMAWYAGQVAARYQGRVAAYTLWNEYKGFWSTSLNRWRHEDITTLYNQVYAEVKAHDPAALMGGSYAPIRGKPSGSPGEPTPDDPAYLKLSSGKIADGRTMSAVLYFLEHARGHDFITLDGVNQHTDEFMAWIRAKGVTQPVVWMEFYADAPSDMGLDEARAMQADNMREALVSGASSMLIWQAQVGSDGFDYQSLWDSSGNPQPFAGMMKAFRAHFGPGTPLYAVSSSSTSVTAAASGTHVLIISRSASAQQVAVDGVVVTLPAWGLIVVPAS